MDDNAMHARKDPLFAFVMSCLVPGWGLLYVGRLKWAIRVAGVFYGSLLLAGIFDAIASPTGIYAVGGFLLLVKLGSAVAAARLARKPRSTTDLPSVRLHILYVAALVLTSFTIFYPLRSVLLGYALYYVPTGSMTPTLSQGDYIVSSTRYDTPRVGDIVVYLFGGTEATKRVAAVGGDTISIVEGEVIVNGRNLGLFHAPAERVKDAHSLVLAPQRVEPGHVYLLGDNRDVSNDSRFMGQVAVDDITGKVTGICFSGERARVGTTFD